MKNLFIKLSKDRYLLSAITIFLLGAFLRFYKLGEYATFLGDQGRDAIIIKKILTLEHLPAIGAPTSVGQVYLGPFYYYFIAPWLLIFSYQPVGLAFGVAFFSSLYILINYFIIKEFFNKKTAIISSFLIASSAVLIESSRFSWNPNLLPVFSLLALYFSIKSYEKFKLFYFVLAGTFLSFSTQLHYLAIFIFVPLLIFAFLKMIENKKQLKVILFGNLLIFLSFLFFSLPLLIFDVRHKFLNTQNFIKLFKYSNTVTNNKIVSLFDTFLNLNKYTFNISINSFFAGLILLIFFLSFILMVKKQNNVRTFLLFFIFLLIGISLYAGPKHQHYFGIIYPIYYILIAYFLSFLTFSLLGNFLIILFLIFYLFFNYQNYYFFHFKGGNQITHAKEVASFLNQIIDNNKFNFAVQPDNWQEDAYLYFLELKGKVPVDRKKLEVSDQMFVVCGKPCDLYKTKSWNINMFGKFKITNEWATNDVKIYKLIHL